MMSKDNPFFGSLLDIVFPPRCASCRTWSETLFCRVCQSRLQPIAAPLCACCGKSFDPLALVLTDSLCADCRANRYHAAPRLTARRAPLEYSGPIRDAIHAFKYRGKTALAAPLADLLWNYLQTPAGRAIPFESAPLVVPIPLHPLRRWRRGFNQSTLLARELSERAQLPCAEILKRTRHTTPQVELGAGQREANVAGAFAVDECALEYLGLEYSRPDTVLLIDDVATTGATLEECARVLKKSGVGEVYALTLARRDF